MCFLVDLFFLIELFFLIDFYMKLPIVATYFSSSLTGLVALCLKYRHKTQLSSEYLFITEKMSSK